MKFRPEVKPFLFASAAFGAVMCLLFLLFGVSGGTSLFLGLLLANISAGYMLFSSGIPTGPHRPTRGWSSRRPAASLPRSPKSTKVNT